MCGEIAARGADLMFWSLVAVVMWQCRVELVVVGEDRLSVNSYFLFSTCLWVLKKVVCAVSLRGGAPLSSHAHTANLDTIFRSDHLSEASTLASYVAGGREEAAYSNTLGREKDSQWARPLFFSLSSSS